MIIKTFPGRAIDVAVSLDGTIYCIGKSSKKVFKWDAEKNNWTALSNSPTDAKSITVDRNGSVWVTHSDRSISRFINNSWKDIDGQAIDIAAAGRSDDVFCVGISLRIFKWNEPQNKWELFQDSPTGVRSIASENSNELWAVLSNRKIMRYHGSDWKTISGGAIDISSQPGANNSVYVIGSSRRLFDWNESEDDWNLTSEIERAGNRLAVEKSGDVITVDIKGKIHRVSTRFSFFNRFIPQEAHDQMGAFQDTGNGIRCFAFTSDGNGWVIITSDNDIFARNIPDECFEKLKEYREQEINIIWVSFSPEGGNRWSIITQKGFFNRNIPEELHERMGIMHSQNKKIKCVAFPPDGGNRWVIISEKDFYARNIPDECFQIMRNINGGQRKVHMVAFEPDGGWLVLANDYMFARNIDDECFSRLNAFRNSGREISLVAFDMDRRGWSIISNQRRTKVINDLPREFELQFSSGSIWKTMRGQNVVGAAVAVVENNQVSWAGGYGHIKIGEGHAIHPETVFQVASISKPLTALGILRLVQDGELGLDDDVTNIIDSDEWSPVRTNAAIINRVQLSINTEPDTCTTGNDGGCQNAVTIRRLLSHSAGTTVWGFGDFNSGPFPTTDQILNGQSPAVNGTVQINYTPGTNARYSGGGFMVLQKVIEETTGISFRRWMKENVLDPLGMSDSFFGLTVPSKYVRDRNAAVAHRSDGTTYSVDRLSDPAFAAASLHSTVLDLSRVIIMVNQGGAIDGNQFLEQNLINTMLTRQHNFSNGVGTRVGLSFHLSSNNQNDTSFNYRHGGTCTGFESELRGYPNRNAGVVALTNTNRTGFDNQIAGAVSSTYNW